MSAEEPELNLPLPSDDEVRTEPRLWVKEFGFFTDFKQEKELRRVSLRRGLNIIWAKESTEGASGHAAGKSTFCRLLRYLIGDPSFGSENFRPALRNKFPEAILIGEVCLEGKPWLLCRSLSEHGHHWAIEGANYEQAFDDDLKKPHYKEFTNALHASFIAPLEVTHYPGTEKALEWQHLLPWLTRDQDARYSEALVWRGVGETHTTLKNEKINLIRLLLNLLSPAELKQQEEHSKNLAKKNQLKAAIPNLKFARDRRVKSLAKDFPKLKDITRSDLQSELEALKKETEDSLGKIEKRLEAANEEDGLDDILRESFKQKSETRNSRTYELTACKNEIIRLRSKRDYRTGKLTEEQHRADIAKLPPTTGRCSELIEDAIAAGCPLVHSNDRDELASQRLRDARDTVEGITADLTRNQSKKERLEKELTNAESQLTPIAKKVEEKKAAHLAAKTKLGRQIIDKSVHLEELEAALLDTSEHEEKRTSLAELEEKLDDSTKHLAELRKRAKPLLSNLTADFDKVASHVTHQEIKGKVKFLADSIKATMNYDGDESSAALITLRLLVFDLAALLGSTREHSHHPGFLLHDSPREADLSVHIYRRLFTLISGTDGQPENESVQYIIATTEAPPEHLQKEPWLACKPLSSESPSSRLLKTIV